MLISCDANTNIVNGGRTCTHSWNLHAEWLRKTWRISCSKYLVQKLKDNSVEDTDIMQISGHKSVQSVKNYSAISEGKHKRISNVLAGV
jgi:hypothetical protein